MGENAGVDGVMIFVGRLFILQFLLFLSLFTHTSSNNRTTTLSVPSHLVSFKIAHLLYFFD